MPPGMKLWIRQTRPCRPDHLHQTTVPQIKLPHKQTNSIGRHASVKQRGDVLFDLFCFIDSNLCHWVRVSPFGIDGVNSIQRKEFSTAEWKVKHNKLPRARSKKGSTTGGNGPDQQQRCQPTPLQINFVLQEDERGGESCVQHRQFIHHLCFVFQWTVKCNRPNAKNTDEKEGQQEARFQDVAMQQNAQESGQHHWHWGRAVPEFCNVVGPLIVEFTPIHWRCDGPPFAGIANGYIAATKRHFWHGFGLPYRTVEVDCVVPYRTVP